MTNHDGNRGLAWCCLVWATAVLGMLALGLLPANAESAAKRPGSGQHVTPPAKPAGGQPALDNEGTLAEQYCRAAVDAVREARHAVQMKQIESLRKEIDARLAKVDARLAELKEWLQKREAFSNLATSQLVGIYAAMRPEAASEQLTKMDEVTAAAIIGRLEARSASAILNDMPSEKAARLATILSDSTRKAPGDGKS